MVTIPIPRAALTITAPLPELVSQRTSEGVLGLPRRAFLDLLPAFRAAGGETIAAGKLRMVLRVDFVAWLRRHGATQSSSRTTAPKPMAANDAAEAADVDSFLAELGMERTRPGNRGRAT